MPVPQDRTGLSHDANLEGARVQVNATGELMGRGVQSPEVSSSVGG
jgi:hypothetical protein